MATANTFVIKNGLTIGTTPVINTAGYWVGQTSVGPPGAPGAPGPTGSNSGSPGADGKAQDFILKTTGTGFSEYSSAGGVHFVKSGGVANSWNCGFESEDYYYGYQLYDPSNNISQKSIIVTGSPQQTSGNLCFGFGNNTTTLGSSDQAYGFMKAGWYFANNGQAYAILGREYLLGHMYFESTPYAAGDNFSIIQSQATADYGSAFSWWKNGTFFTYATDYNTSPSKLVGAIQTNGAAIANVSINYLGSTGDTPYAPSYTGPTGWPGPPGPPGPPGSSGGGGGTTYTSVSADHVDYYLGPMNSPNMTIYFLDYTAYNDFLTQLSANKLNYSINQIWNNTLNSWCNGSGTIVAGGVNYGYYNYMTGPYYAINMYGNSFDENATPQGAPGQVTVW